MDIIFVIALIAGAIWWLADNGKVVRCASCSWRGTKGRWSSYSGCPTCRSDLFVESDV